MIFAGLGNPTFAICFRSAPDGGLSGRRSGRQRKAHST